MSHHIYHTEAIVISVRHKGEADSSVLLLTRDLGLIWAHCAGIRYLKSKSRYGLQQYSHACVDVVRGKEVWRLTSSQSLFVPDLKIMKEFAILSRLIQQMVPPEEEIEGLYEDVVSTLVKLQNYPTLLHRIVVVYSGARILQRLGYWPDTHPLPFLVVEDITKDMYQDLQKQQEGLVSLIRESIRESHLAA